MMDEIPKRSLINMFDKYVFAIFFILKLCSGTNFSIINYIRRNYGEEESTLYRKFENSSRKLQKSQLDINFLLKCKIYNIFPKFLRFKLHRKSILSSDFYRSWQMKLLNNEIRFKKKTAFRLTKEVSDIEKDINSKFSKLISIIIKKKVKLIVDKFKESTERTHERKLFNLGIENKLEPVDPEKVIFNYSSIAISKRLKFLLAFGLDFGLPVYKLNYYKYFFSFEKLVSCLKPSECTNFQEMIEQLKSIAYKYYYKFNPSKVFSAIFSKSDINLLKSLSKNSDIIITRPDKGRGVVITDRSKYIEKLTEIISDKTKFREINIPLSKFTLRIEDKINKFLRIIKSMKMLSETHYSDLRVSGSGPGILYGLPKVHKKDFAKKFQFRPIFAAYNTPSFKLAKFLVPILSPLTTNEFTVENSSKFVQDITKINNAHELFMTSFDVENLFTNIPLQETIDICIEKLFNSTNSVFGITQKFFKTLLEHSVLNSFFIFNKKIYQQIEGLGMGLPLGPTFANIFMCYHEKKWISDCPVDFKPVFYRRYVDDTFILFKDSSHAPKFLDYLNSKHQNMKFTMETENNHQLPFLDCLVTRSDNQFSTSVYRKSTFTGLGISYFSYCTQRFKLNSIKTLLHRAFEVSSNFHNLHIEFDFLKNFFKMNGFPTKLIENMIGKFLKQKLSPPPLKITVPKKPLYFTLPYFGPKSEELKEEISTTLSRYFMHIKFNPILINSNTIGSFFKFKDKLPLCSCSSVIYKYRCSLCESEYIGSTRRTLGMRLAEHKGLSFRTNLKLTSPPHSSIRDHLQNCESSISENNFKILSPMKNYPDILILESIYIHRDRPNLNDMQSAYPLKIVN